MRVSWREMRAVVAAFAANLGIAVIKFVAFLLTGSASLLAESVHSVADTGNQVLLFVGRGRSSRPASDDHPFGFGRERYFYGFVVSVMLFTVGAVYSVYEGIHKIVKPAAIHSPIVAFIVLALSAVLEAFSLRTAIREANKVRGNRNWGTFIRRTKAPELPVVLLEDLAALIGLTFAFAGVALSVLTGDGIWDGAGSLAIGVLLATAAAILAVEMKSLLIGESASPEVQRMVVAALEDGPELARVIHMRTVHMSPDSILVAAKVAVRDTDSAAQITAGIDTAERRVRASVPIAKTIYLEPDIYRPREVDQTDPSIRAVQRSHSPVPPHGGGAGPRSPENPENPAPADCAPADSAPAGTLAEPESCAPAESSETRPPALPGAPPACPPGPAKASDPGSRHASTIRSAHQNPGAASMQPGISPAARSPYATLNRKRSWKIRAIRNIWWTIGPRKFRVAEILRANSGTPRQCRTAWSRETPKAAPSVPVEPDVLYEVNESMGLPGA